MDTFSRITLSIIAICQVWALGRDLWMPDRSQTALFLADLIGREISHKILRVDITQISGEPFGGTGRSGPATLPVHRTDSTGFPLE
jgi:hypothetical protein